MIGWYRLAACWELPILIIILNFVKIDPRVRAVWQPSSFSYQEENSIIKGIQSALYKPILLMKMRSEKINIYFDTVYHTTAHYTAQHLFAICNHNIRFLLSELKRYLAR